MNKAERITVYEKYNGHCAYCGKAIQIKDMQVDHIEPRHLGGKDELSNYNPACRRCNRYKMTFRVEYFRKMIKTIHERVMKTFISKIAADYGIIEIKEWDGKFYFEKQWTEKNDQELKDMHECGHVGECIECTEFLVCNYGR